MKILTFQAERFAWRPHEQTWNDASRASAEPLDVNAATAEVASDAVGKPIGAIAPGSVTMAVVAFVHAEAKDQLPEARERALRHATKHITWLANKRSLKNVVLHSFTHLAADSAEATFAEAWLREFGSKLETKGYGVSLTPFGYTCAWELSVFGESLAKVWKEI